MKVRNPTQKQRRPDVGPGGGVLPQKIAPVALVRPSRELRPSKDPAESVNFLWCYRHGSMQTKVREGGLSDETQLRSNEGLMGVWGPPPGIF